MKSDLLSDVAEFMRTSRIRAGKSQLDVAKELGLSSCQLISNWERGKCDPPLKSIATLCRFLNINKKEYKQILVDRYEKKISEALRG